MCELNSLRQKGINSVLIRFIGLFLIDILDLVSWIEAEQSAKEIDNGVIVCAEIPRIEQWTQLWQATKRPAMSEAFKLKEGIQASSPSTLAT